MLDCSYLIINFNYISEIEVCNSRAGHRICTRKERRRAVLGPAGEGEEQVSLAQDRLQQMEGRGRVGRRRGRPRFGGGSLFCKYRFKLSLFRGFHATKQPYQTERLPQNLQ